MQGLLAGDGELLMVGRVHCGCMQDCMEAQNMYTCICQGCSCRNRCHL